MDKERLEFLLSLYFDQLLSVEEKSELKRMLLESGPARETFWDFAHWHGMLRQWGQQEWGRRDSAEPIASRQTPQPRLRPLPSPARTAARARPIRPQPRPASAPWWPLAAAAALVLGAFAWWQYTTQAPASAQTDNAGNGIAILTHTATALWADGATAHQSGELLSAGWLKLKSGAFQVEFSRGARAVVQGPAEFELLTDNSAAIRYGRVMLTVPEPAHGFSLQAPKFSVVDHGTQFGCFVPLAGPPEVHVFLGLVSLETAGSAVQEQLGQNQAVRLTEGQVQAIQPNINAFITEGELSRMDDKNAQVRLAAWREWSDRFDRHPGMLVHYDFTNDDAAETGHLLMNRVPHAPPETNATVIGCEWTEGRWPGKGALQFTRGDDRVRLSVPGEYGAMTFLAWIRAEGTPFRENSLVMTESHDQLGEANWYLFHDGSLGWRARVAPRRAADQWLHIKSEPIFRDGGLGSWRLAATVFDGATVTHYFDGRVVGSGAASLATPVHLGRIEIGNWSAGSPGDNRRNSPAGHADHEIIGNFFGSIDEVAILSVPLSPAEIQEVFLQGRPGEN